MTIWFTSDNHWFHKRMTDIRGFATPGLMNESMRDVWNSYVRPNDTVYNLGDVAFAPLALTIPFLKTLHGRQHLILGNHDKLITKKRDIFLEAGVFHSIQRELTIKLSGHEIYLHHFPHRTWEKAQYDAIHLFGHTHGYLGPRGRSVDVGVDDKNITDEYRPVSMDEVLAFMENRERHTNHHDGADALAMLDRMWDHLPPAAKQEAIELIDRLSAMMEPDDK